MPDVEKVTFDPLWGKQLQGRIEALLASEIDDLELRSALEELSRQWGFSGFTWFWGPRLWRRNRVVFRPFILSNFSTWQRVSKNRWKVVKWNGEIGRQLDQWFSEVEATEEVALFRSLLNWQIQSQVGGTGFRISPQATRFRSELVTRFESARSAGERQLVLQRFRYSYWMDEDTAVRMYELDHRCAGFLTANLPIDWWSGEKRALWPRLQALAQERGDEAFAWSIYRSRVPIPTWQADVLKICSSIPDPEALVEALENRHPRCNADLGSTFAEMLSRRGREVLPYVARHLFSAQRGFLFRKGYGAVIDVVRKHEWHDLEAALLRTCGSQDEFNKAVRALVESRLSDENVHDRLQLLAGTSREWNFPGLGIAQVHQLKDDVAVSLYRRFPELVHGPFKPHVQSRNREALTKFTDTIIEAGDEQMLDFIASRTVFHLPWMDSKPWKIHIEKLTSYYQELKSTPEVFCTRSISVLTQVPAFSIPNYRRLIRSNALARLLLQRSPRDFLAHPPSLADLIEAQEIHVMALAYRVLALDDDRARQAAVDSLDVLIGTLLRPLHRRTRMLAFDALLNAASAGELHASRILVRAREALDLPDQRYPKEALIGLIGKIIHRWPGLRSGTLEIPIIYRDKVA
ncbi:MAG: hypothetical protein R3F19_08470 [Verrucomicrobiales bacterium]